MFFPDLSSQIQVNNLTIHAKKSSKNKIKPSTENILVKNKKKGDKEEKQGMDIRDFMGIASGKVSDMQKEDITVSQSLPPQSFSSIQSLPDILNEKIIPKCIVKEVSHELHCIFCKKGVNLMTNKTSEHLGDNLIPFTLDQLSSVEMFVKDISREVIFSLKTLNVFSNSNRYTSRELSKNITVLKQTLEQSHIKKTSSAEDFQHVNSLFEVKIQIPQKPSVPEVSQKQNSSNIIRTKDDSDKVLVKEVPNDKPLHLESVLVDINDLFENEFESLSSSSQLNKSMSCDLQRNCLLDVSPKKNYFNLDDIFNEDSDELPFSNLTKNTTSTPISHKNVPSRSTDICSVMVTSTTKEKEVPDLTKDSLSITQTSSEKIFKKVTCHLKNSVFKIPQIKFETSLYRNHTNVQNVDNEDIILTPLSPVLSGQISTQHYVNDIYKQSPESPILSGRIKNQKPLNFPNKPKIECRALFEKDKSLKKYENHNDFSLLCEPLDNSKTESDISTENEKHIISTSQLFEDEPTEENKNDTLDQSSMYTITQMVNKISSLTKHTESENVTRCRINSVKTSSVVDWGSFEEDYLLSNVNLDNLTDDTPRPSVNITPQDNICTTNGQSKVETNTTHFPLDVKTCLTPLMVKNQSFSGSKILDCSKSWSTTDVNEESEKSVNKSVLINEKSLVSSQRLSCVKSPLNRSERNINPHSIFSNATPVQEIEKSVNKTIQNDEGSQISYRWLSCMRSPLNESKINNTVIGRKTSSDSDSNSDIFQSPVSRKRVIIQEKTGKVAKKVNLYYGVIYLFELKCTIF